MRRLFVALLLFSIVLIVSQSVAENESIVEQFEELTVQSDSTAGYLSGNVSSLDSIFLKMMELRGGSLDKLTILHIGDSHIQAGYLTGEVRRKFQHDFGNAGRGLIMPLKILGTNEPSDYAIISPNNWIAASCSKWEPSFDVGLGGIAIATGDKNIVFSIKSYETPFNQVTAFHHAQAPLLVEDSIWSIGSVCDYFSTDMSTHIVLNQTTDSVVLRGDLSDPDYRTPIFFGFSLENGCGGVLYHSVGINGCSYEHYNRSPQIASQMSLLGANLIIVSLGTNDSFGRRFSAENSYNSILKFVKSLQENNPDAVIMLTTPMECCTRRVVRGRAVYSVNKNLSRVRDNIIRVADELSLVYWDMYSAAGGEGAMNKWYKDKLAQRDRIHLTKEGYAMLGDMFYEAFINSYNCYVVRDK